MIMGTDEKRAPRRLEMVRELKDKYGQPDPPEVAEAKQAKARIRDQIARAESPPDDPELCLDCWVYHGERLRMVQQSSAERGVDIRRCANGHEERHGP